MGVQEREPEWVRGEKCMLVMDERHTLVSSGSVMVRWQVADGGETGQGEKRCELEPHSHWPWQ